MCKLCLKALTAEFDGAPCAVKVACTVWSGENPEIISKDYLSLSGAKSQGIKQLMAGAGIMLLGTTLIPQLATLFS